ncbi:hypothetical protein TNCV_1859961 [Trichonephila clavipes]|nr:hypothetical protein TNCV_1859961 [Trichonephila clavipes]
MNRYTKAELAYIYFIYRLANGNTAFRLYGELYPKEQQPKAQNFAQVHQKLAKHGSFRSKVKDMNSRKQHEHPYLKTMCCMFWIKIPVPV